MTSRFQRLRAPNAKGHMHLTVENCLALIRGELSPQLFMRTLHRHLIDACPECKEEWLAASEELGISEPFPIRARSAEPALRPLPKDPRLILPSDIEAREQLLARLLAERREARKELKRLLADSPAERRRRFARARVGLSSPALAEMLVDESRELAEEVPAEAADLAGLVPLVLARARGGDSEPWAAALAALAEAHRANALRLGGDVVAAAAVFDRLMDAHAERPLTDGPAEAELLTLEALLRFDEGRPAEAESLVERALELLAEGGGSVLGREQRPLVEKRARELSDRMRGVSSSAPSRRSVPGRLPRARR